MPSLQDEVESLSRGEITEIADRLVKTSAEQRWAKRLEKSAGGFTEGITNFIKNNPGTLAGGLAGGIGGGVLGGMYTEPDEEGKYKGRTRNILGGALAGAGLGAGFGHIYKRLGQIAGPARASYGLNERNLKNVNELPGDLIEKGRQQFADIESGPRRFVPGWLKAIIAGDVGLHGTSSIAQAYRSGINQMPTGNIHEVLRGAQNIVDEYKATKDLSKLPAETRRLFRLSQRLLSLGETHKEDLQRAVNQARGGWTPIPAVPATPSTPGVNAVTAQNATPMSDRLLKRFTPAQMGAVSARGRPTSPLPGVSEVVDAYAWLKSLIPGLKPANRLTLSGYAPGPGGLGIQPVTGRLGTALRWLSAADVSKPISPWIRGGGRLAAYGGVPLLTHLGSEYFGMKHDVASKNRVLQKLIEESAARKK